MVWIGLSFKTPNGSFGKSARPKKNVKPARISNKTQQQSKEATLKRSSTKNNKQNHKNQTFNRLKHLQRKTRKTSKPTKKNTQKTHPPRPPSFAKNRRPPTTGLGLALDWRRGSGDSADGSVQRENEKKTSPKRRRGGWKTFLILLCFIV